MVSGENEIRRAKKNKISISKPSVFLPEKSGRRKNKSILFQTVLPDLKRQFSFFSFSAIKQALAQTGINTTNATLWQYMSEAVSSGILFDAGRGWYTRHGKPAHLDPKTLGKIIGAVKKAYPLLDFSCWSTVQFNPFARHLIAQPMTLLYVEIDVLESLAEALREAGWDAWANPTKNVLVQLVHPGEKTVVLRQSITKQPESSNHIAPIEKAMVDLLIESKRLRLMDITETQWIIDAILRAGTIYIPILIGYLTRRGLKINSRELT